MYSDQFAGRPLNLTTLLSTFRWRILATWLLVAIENVVMALIPLTIGIAIDGLLDKQTQQLIPLAALLMSLICVGVFRRLYDTRAYGAIRVELGLSTVGRHQQSPTSSQTARLDMARELVDFLENEVPQVMTGAIQVVITVIVLSIFHWQLAAAALLLGVGMLTLYALFHSSFYGYNKALNDQMEKQVSILGRRSGLKIHLQRLRHWEIKLSDTEAWVYGAIFTLACGFILHNLWFSTQMLSLSTGKIFSVVNYSWDFVEAATLLPVTLQSWSRLSEITERLNADQSDAGPITSPR